MLEKCGIDSIEDLLTVQKIATRVMFLDGNGRKMFPIRSITVPNTIA